MGDVNNDNVLHNRMANNESNIEMMKATNVLGLTNCTMSLAATNGDSLVGDVRNTCKST